jgi:pyruvate/2-oxoglutarate dehydrogenase complex dihydrolipoamide dehydrogenase (E3) component
MPLPKNFDHDMIVLGGGSGGYSAARTARDAGADVAIVDPGPLGGLCILRGCMPSKAILRSSDIMALIRRAGEFGLHASNIGADLGAIMDRKNRLIAEFTDYRVEQLRGFTLYEDYGRFLSNHEIQVGDRTLTAKSFVIATGSLISHVPIPGLDEIGYLTSDDLLELRDPPESMLVIGAGSVACELAQFYQRIGVDVTIIQRSHHILSSVDEDLARPVEARLREDGATLFTGTQLHRFSQENGSKIAHFSHEGEEKTAAAQVVFLALGRRPNTAGLGLEQASVQLEGHRVCVNAEMRTNQPKIFAVGDVNGVHEIVHIAIQQGEAAAHNAVNPESVQQVVEERLTMSVTFTNPHVAIIGRTEGECQAEDVPYLVATHPFDDHGKSMCLSETHGLVKLLCDPTTGEILGAGICGPEAGELIHELSAVMYFRGTVRDLVRIPHYHPTLAEILTYPAEELEQALP